MGEPPLFSIVHCTSRPLGWQGAYAHTRRNIALPNNVEYILCFDEAQQAEFERVIPARWFDRADGLPRAYVHQGPREYVAAANWATQFARGKIIIEASDDMFCPPAFDQHIVDVIDANHPEWAHFNEEFAIWVYDGAFRGIMTLQIFSAAWYKRYGFVFSPAYGSMNADRDLTLRANRDGVIIDCRDMPELRWDHQHHRNGQRVKDASDGPNGSASRYYQGWKQLYADWPDHFKCDPIDALYSAACNLKSDIAEHLPKLKEIASGKEVLELGTRAGNSTIAFLAGRPKRLVSVDLDFSRLDTQIEGAAMYSEIPFEMKQQDSREEAGDFDVIFFDTVHTYAHLKAEIATHAPHARERLVFHDTVTNSDTGEDGRTPGLIAAIYELMYEGAWEIESHARNNNGLLILRHVSVDVE